MSSRSLSWHGFSATIEVPQRAANFLRRTRGLVPRTSGRLLFADPLPQLLLEDRDVMRSAEYFRNWFGRHDGEDTSSPYEAPTRSADLTDISKQVSAIGWYHTIDLGNSVVTPGIFDHRPLVPHYGLPLDLSNQTALDVATFDGFWAFEMERRGAQVTAIDIPSLLSLDLPPQLRAEMVAQGLEAQSGEGFSVARRALRSKVERITCSVYDLSPDRVGTFDLVHVADLLLHLQSPITALQRIRSVTHGQAMIVDVFDPRLLSRGGHAVQYQGGWWSAIWWTPSLNALAQMVLDAGFSRVSLHNAYNLAGATERDGLWRAIIMAYV